MYLKHLTFLFLVVNSQSLPRAHKISVLQKINSCICLGWKHVCLFNFLVFSIRSFFYLDPLLHYVFILLSQFTFWWDELLFDLQKTARSGLHILLGGICALTVVVFFRFVSSLYPFFSYLLYTFYPLIFALSLIYFLLIRTWLS